jgi:biotin/methionine sulfoxide reductase
MAEMPAREKRGLPHSAHWGAFSVLVRDREIEILPHRHNPAPSALLRNIPVSVSHKARVAQPMIRRGWLEDGPGPNDRRGVDAFVPIDWPEALDRVAAELDRVYTAYGPRAVFGSSYGWATPGVSMTRSISSTVFSILPVAMCARSTATAPALRACCCRT